MLTATLIVIICKLYIANETVTDNGFCDDVYIIGIMEHIEPCGIHSGDSNAVLPTFNLDPTILKKIESYTKKIALALKTVGLINVQFAIKNGEKVVRPVLVIVSILLSIRILLG